MLYRERRKEKGVSEVIGTILILGITVTLFSTIFYYVAVMPPPKAQIYASFSSNYNLNPNGSFNITILNSGGEPVPVNYTELVISTQNSSGAIRIIHMLSYSKIANQLKGNYFNVGQSFYYNSTWDHVKGVTYLNPITVYLIDTQNNQVLWSNELQGEAPYLTIVGATYSPDPILANTTTNVTFNAFVLFNIQSKAIPHLSMYLGNVTSSSLHEKAYVNMVRSYMYTFTASALIGLNNMNKNIKYHVLINASLNGVNVTPYVLNLNFNFISFNETLLHKFKYVLAITNISVSGNFTSNSKNMWLNVTIVNPFNTTEFANITLIVLGINKSGAAIVSSSISLIVNIPSNSVYPIHNLKVGISSQKYKDKEYIIQAAFLNVNPIVPNQGYQITYLS